MEKQSSFLHALAWVVRSTGKEKWGLVIFT